MIESRSPNRHVFKYLLINSVPLGRGSVAGRFTAGELWLEDLRAEAAAIRGVGGQLTVALPLVETLDPGRSGSFGLREFVPEQEGFEFVPLPWYGRWSEYLRGRTAIIRTLGAAMQDAAVVQMDTSGHPLPLNGLVWGLAGKTGCKRVFVFDGGDLIGQREVSAKVARGGARRVYRRLRNQYLYGRCRDAIRSADLVFTHNDATRGHFEDVWGPHCHQLDRSYVTSDMIVGEAEVAARVTSLKAHRGSFRLVAAGRLIPIKAIDQAIRAVASARAKVDVRLDVYGEGPERDRLARLIQELGTEEVVTLHSPVPYGPELFDRLKQADAMLITNIVPELSRNYLLAMALGLPIITYANPGSDSLMARSGAGIVVPSGDWNALAQAMIVAAGDPSSLTGFVETGPKFAKKTTLEACHRRRAELVADLLRCDVATAAGVSRQPAGAV